MLELTCLHTVNGFKYSYWMVTILFIKYSSSSSSSCRAGSTDIPDPLSPLFSIVHCLRQVFWTTSRILTQLLNVYSCWSSCFCTAMRGVHNSTSLMSSSLLLQQCPACLVRQTWIVFMIGGRWPYSWCLVGCCRQDLHRYLWFQVNNYNNGS